MSVNLSIKNVPDEVAERLRLRAERNHRSLQRELLALVTESVRPRPPLTIDELLREGRALGLSTPSESAAIVREARNARRRR